MGHGMTKRRTLDVSHLPTVVFGTHTTIWLGFIGVVIVEGTMILLIIVGYFYLQVRGVDWPTGVSAPPHAAATSTTAVFVLSMWPAALLKRAAQQGSVGLVRRRLLMLSAAAVAMLALIGWSFISLNVRWDTNAYGSLVWMLIGTYAVAFIAAALILWVLTIYMFTGMLEGRRFMNVYQSADYWLLAAALWLAVWTVIYIAPRVLSA